jgi:hypothetical protein
MRLLDQLDDLGLLGRRISHAASAHPRSGFLSRRFSRVRLATISFKAVASPTCSAGALCSARISASSSLSSESLSLPLGGPSRTIEKRSTLRLSSAKGGRPSSCRPLHRVLCCVTRESRQPPRGSIDARKSRYRGAGQRRVWRRSPRASSRAFSIWHRSLQKRSGARQGLHLQHWPLRSTSDW